MAVSKKVLDFNKNEDMIRLKISEMENKLETIYMGGGKKRIEKHKEWFNYCFS